MASIPFGGRYRLIDFPLSNMVNSGITNIGVIAHSNYRSLMDHIGTGKDWDLARRSGGIKVLPPYITAFANTSNSLYTTRLEALIGISEFINGCTEDYVVLSDCDCVCNFDIKSMVDYHLSTGADATFAVKRQFAAKSSAGILPFIAKNHLLIESDETGRITDVAEYRSASVSGYCDLYMNICVMRKRYLEDILYDASAHGYKSFYKDVIAKNLIKADYRIYSYNGYYSSIDTLSSYYYCNMDLLSAPFRKQLFKVESRPIYTSVQNSPPTLYKSTAEVKNSLIADGCIIEGKVENSILFRGVKIGKGTTVSNCILMQDTLTGENVDLRYVISDKKAVIRDGRLLCGCDRMPLFINKEAIV
jgi:glucose-1-phosphate adenylyltransferase